MRDVGFSRDSRFVGVSKDPKFRRLRKWERKVKIDERFESMFKSDAFKINYSVDKRGRRVPRTSDENLKKFYDLPSDESGQSSEDESADEDDREDGTSSSDSAVAEMPSSNRVDDDVLQKRITPAVRQKLKDMTVDYARGEGKLFSDSSSDEKESEDSDSELIYHEWNELDKDAEITENVTNRLAVCNMDWDRIKAVDLMVLFDSFLPPKALIRSVIIYPSEFGSKRLADEDVHGPAELRNTYAECESDSDRDEENEQGKRFQMERMRRYQLNRLRYYYAVVTFDTPETADFVYSRCNGVEYESSGIKLDLRFVDDDVSFDQEIKDSCYNVDDYGKYNPSFFTNTALQQAKVESTWDETDPRRIQFAQKITQAARTVDIDDADLKDFVALSTSGEEEEEEEEDDHDVKVDVKKESETEFAVNTETSSDNDELESEFIGCGSKIKNKKLGPIKRFRNLLKEIEANEKNDKTSDEDVEITWGAADIDSAPNKSAVKKLKNRKESPSSRVVKLRDKDVAATESENVKRGKKKTKKNGENDVKDSKELELLLTEGNEDNNRRYNLKKIRETDETIGKKKNKRAMINKSYDEDVFQVDVNDRRFEALYSSHLYNLDPTNPKFTKTKGMNAFVAEKLRRMSRTITKDANQLDEPFRKKKKDSDLSHLLNSIKRKTKSLIPNKFDRLK